MERHPEDLGRVPGMSPENSAEIEEELLAIRASFRRFSREERNDDDTIGQLTTWQTTTFRAIGRFINDHTLEDLHGRCDIACGGGKSAIAIYTANALGAGRVRPDGRKRQVLLCTSRNGIIKQLNGTNTHYDDPEELVSDFQYFAPDLAVSIYNKYHKNSDGDVVVMPYASVPRALERGDIYPSKFSGFLLDESHNIGFAVKHSLGACAQGMPMIGFSATPGRSKHFLPHVIDRIPMIDGIMKHKFLSNTRLLGIESGQMVRRQNVRSRNFQPADIAPLTVNDLRNQKIIETARFGVSHLGPGWIRCHPKYRGLDHTEAVAELINDSGPIIDQYGDSRPIRIEPVGASRKNSQDIIDEFTTTDAIDGLTYVKLIGEGYNIPKFRWGLWVPPTLSYDLLEQALGRGNRLDKYDQNKLFTFYQMIDVTPNKHDRLAFAWELFGISRNSRNVTTITHTGISETPMSETSQTNIEVPDFLRHIARRPRPEPLHALDIASRPLEEQKIVHALDTLWSATGLDRTWARRILFHGGYGASVVLAEDDMFDFFYEADALPFLLDSVARPEDLSLPDAALSLGISERNIRALMEDYGYDFTYLYPREPGAWPIPRLYVRADIIKTLRAERGVRRDLLSDEITTREIADRTGLRPNHLAQYLGNRGFVFRPVRVKGSATLVPVGNRSEIEPWIQAYIRAPEAPPKGFKQLTGYCKTQKDGTKAELSEVIEAAKRTGAKIWLFKYRAGARYEYIQATYHERLKEELSRLVQHRYAKPVPSASERLQVDNIRQSIRANPDVIQYHARSLGIELDTANPPTIDELELLKSMILKTRRSLAIFHDEPCLTEAVTGKPRDLHFPARSQVPSVEPQQTPKDSIDPPAVIFSTIGRREAPDRLLQLAGERYGILSTVSGPRDYLGRAIIDTATYDALRQILRNSNIQPGDIRPDWQYVGDIAVQLNVNHRSLMKFLISKNLADTHFRCVELARVRGIFAFCSPQLAKTLLQSTR